MSAIWDAIHPSLATLVQPFPEEAYRLANAHRDECRPHLLAALEAMVDRPLETVTGSEWLHIHAMYLLAQWRDPAALAPLLRLCRRTEDEIEHLIGDDITEGLPRCLASVCGDDVAPLRELVADPAVTYWVRHAALDAWIIRVVQGDAPRAPLLEFLLTLGQAEATRLRHPDTEHQVFEMLDCVVGGLLDIGASETTPLVRGWFDENLCDPQICDWSYFAAHVGESLEFKRAKMDRHNKGYLLDAAAELRPWDSFKTAAQQRIDTIRRRGQRFRAGAKVGRNDPCPCGSGKKHKKCCGA